MAERRSLGDALTLSPEKLAFIKGNEVEETASRSHADSAVRTIELGEIESRGVDKQPGTRPVRSASRSQRPRVEAAVPNANEVLDELLVPLTTRLPHRLVQALRRVCLEQRLRHAKPDSIQEIVETAIESWLAKER